MLNIAERLNSTKLKINHLIQKAIIFKEESNYKEAKKTWNEAEKLLSEGDKNNYWYTIKHNQAVTLKIMGDYPKALEIYNELENACDKGKEFGTYIAILSSKAACYTDRGDYKEALECLEKAITICKKQFGEEHHEYAGLLLHEGNIFSRQGEAEKALRNYNKAYLVAARIFGKDSLYCIPHKQNIANALMGLGTFEESKKLYEEIIVFYNEFESSIQFKRNVSIIHNLANCLVNMSKTCSELEEKKEYLCQALKKYNNVLIVRKEILGEQHVDYATTLNNIGNVYVEEKSFELAYHYHNKSAYILMKNYIQEQITANQIEFLSALDNFARIISYTGVFEYLIECKDSSDHVKNSIEVLKYIVSIQNKELIFSQMEKATIIGALQELIQEQNEIVVKPYALAYYLLTKLYKLHGQEVEAKQVLEEFAKAASVDADKVTQHLLAAAQKELPSVAMAVTSWVSRTSEDGLVVKGGRAI